MSIWKHGNLWRYKFRWKGQTIQSPKGYETQEEVRLAQAAKRVSLSKIKTIRMEFGKLCNSRLSDLQAKRDRFYYLDNRALANRLIRKEGWGLLKTIDEGHVKTFLDKIAVETSPQRANKYLSYLKALFNYGISARLIDGNPALEVEKYPEIWQPKYVPPEKDVYKVIVTCTPEQKDYLWTLILTAARCREINRLKIEDVHFDLSHITISTRKAKNSDISYRRISIGTTLKEILKRRIKAAMKCGSDYVFFNTRTGKPFNYRSKFITNKCMKAKVQPFTYHCLRHFASVIMDREGVPLTDIQNILGHQRATTTDTYLSSVRSAQPSAINKLEARLRGRYNKSLLFPKKSDIK